MVSHSCFVSGTKKPGVNPGAVQIKDPQIVACPINIWHMS
jgi:hypothetical protein